MSKTTKITKRELNRIVNAFVEMHKHVRTDEQEQKLNELAASLNDSLAERGCTDPSALLEALDSKLGRAAD